MSVSAWGQVFASASEPHWDALLRFAMNLGLSREEARDVLQNALLRGMKYFETFARTQLGICEPSLVPEAVSGEGPLARRFRGWLYTVVRNATYDLHGAKGKRELLLGEEEWEGLAQRSATQPLEFGEQQERVASGTGESDGRAFTEKEIELQANALFNVAADDELLQGLQALNPRQKSILYLVAEDHTYAEVASILGIPIGTVMSGLSRALRKVKGHLVRSKDDSEEIKTRSRGRGQRE